MPGVVRAAALDVETIHGRRPTITVVVDGTERAGALTETAGLVIETAARTALAERLPLVIELASSGADVDEGIAALHGWGRAAAAITACSGMVPTVALVNGPAVSGPALLLGLVDHVVMTEEAYAFVSGPHMVRQFTGVPVAAATLGGSGAHARATGRRLPRRHGHGRRTAPRRHPCSTSSRPTTTSCRRGSPPTTRTTGRPRRPERSSPTSATGCYDVRSVIRALADDGRSSSCGPAGLRTSSPPSPPSAGGRSASSPTSPARWPARSTSRRRRRAPGSSPSATPSTSRWSPWSTPRASTRARTSSGAA